MKYISDTFAFSKRSGVCNKRLPSAHPNLCEVSEEGAHLFLCTFNPQNAYSCPLLLVARGVQSCELKKNPFFEILFAAHIGTLVGFAGPPGRHS